MAIKVNKRYNPSEFFIDCKKRILRGFLLKDYIEERAVAIANYIIDHNATVRQTAKRFGISKSTVHKDCTERLISHQSGSRRPDKK